MVNTFKEITAVYSENHLFQRPSLASGNKPSGSITSRNVSTA
jgi:hypothetical protein